MRLAPVRPWNPSLTGSHNLMVLVVVHVYGKFGLVHGVIEDRELAWEKRSNEA